MECGLTRPAGPEGKTQFAAPPWSPWLSFLLSYQVIARKYRPQRFSDVVGQEHVTQTLANAIAQRIAQHLFCGPAVPADHHRPRFRQMPQLHSWTEGGF
jgi:hypothetical protein